MLLVEQIKAARMLLLWDQNKLAEKSGVGISTIKRLESNPGVIGGTMETVVRLRTALEEAGIIFIPADKEGGVGVRLVRAKK
jgi:transcriptional regulator with XRE-family HTH domain